MRWSTRLLSLLLFSSLAACGGSGAPPEGEQEQAEVPADPPPSAPTLEGRPQALIGPSAAIRGSITLPTGMGATVQETEPNDTFGTASRIGVLRAGSEVLLAGTLSEKDPQDGFRFAAPERVRLVVRLLHRADPYTNFDVLVHDAASSRRIEAARTAEVPEIGRVVVRGVVDVVVRRKAGAGAYQLMVRARPVDPVLVEEEPNNRLGRGTYLGGIYPGDRVHVRGVASATTDAADVVRLSLLAEGRLRFYLEYLDGARASVDVLDVTDGAANALPLASLAVVAPTRMEGTADVPAGVLLAIRVTTPRPTLDWRMTVTSEARPSELRLARPLPPRSPGLPGLETSQFEEGAETQPYGVVSGAIIPGEVIVRIPDGADLVAARTQFELQGLQYVAGRANAPLLFRLAGALPNDQDAGRRITVSAAALADASPWALLAGTNAVMRASAVPNDPLYRDQWHYPLVRLPEAWEIGRGSAEVVVAVVDTGSTPHPDLAGRWTPGYDFVSWTGISMDGDGLDADPTDMGTAFWHGTHVAGTIGALTNNALGVSGVAWNVKIMPVRVLGREGRGSTWDVLQGFLYAAGLPNESGLLPTRAARIVNMSLGGGGPNAVFQEAIRRARAAGVIVVAAAGNESSSDPSYPAAFEGVISVGGVNRSRALAWYSNFGPTVDVVAPGGDSSGGVLSTSWTGTSTRGSPTYTAYNGTSMASPHVAGLVALMVGMAPTLTPDRVEDMLIETAQDLGAPGRDDTFGAGLINAYGAILAAQRQAAPSLRLSPSTLDLGWGADALSSSVRNAGGGFLRTTGVTVVEGAPWLSAVLTGYGDATRNADAVQVTVVRRGLTAGPYQGRLSVAWQGGPPREVIVRMEVPEFDVNQAVATRIHVLLLDANTGAVVAKQRLQPAVSRAFAFEALPRGRYLLVAGTDADADGFIGGRGELFGQYGTQEGPEPIALTAGQILTGMDFAVRPVFGRGTRYAR